MAAPVTELPSAFRPLTVREYVAMFDRGVLTEDDRVGLARYAMGGYPEYRVVDVHRRTVHVHRGPRADGTWDKVTRVTEGVLVAVAAAPIAIDLAELFS